jgi:hypothetical protein
LNNSTTPNYVHINESNYIYRGRNVYKDTESLCEKLFGVVEILREAMQENLHYLKTIQQHHESLAQFTSGRFWDCAPTLIKNFIGLLTSIEHDFRSFKNDYQCYNLFDQDIYKLSDKSLKISSIVYDIVGTRYNHYSTPITRKRNIPPCSIISFITCHE